MIGLQIGRHLCKMPLLPPVSKQILLKDDASTPNQKVDDKKSTDPLAFARQFFPRLTKSLRKGHCGRVAVIGGSPQYSGALYFSSISPILAGADLSYVFCHPDAATSLKSYSPELIVEPTLDFKKIKPALDLVHTIVFGPGLGRDLTLCVPLLKDLLSFIVNTPEKCLVIDADGLFILTQCLDYVKGLKDRVILTPNHYEFDRLFNKFFTDRFHCDKKNVEMLARELDVCIVKKDEVDIITNGLQTKTGNVSGTLRRCGGQGDIFSSLTALFAYWAKFRDCNFNKVIVHDSLFYSEYLLDGALAASDFVRFTAAQTFCDIGRSMTAGDIIAKIPYVVRNHIDKKDNKQ